MAMAFIPDSELLPMVNVNNAKLSREKERRGNVDEENKRKDLAINQCMGEKDANLDAIIARYAETINKYNLRNLGRVFVLDFLSLVIKLSKQKFSFSSSLNFFILFTRFVRYIVSLGCLNSLISSHFPFHISISALL